VYRQPQTEEEISLCIEVVDGCPLSVVCSDGDEYDWARVTCLVDRKKIIK
jgi:hypothetical protein